MELTQLSLLTLQNILAKYLLYLNLKSKLKYFDRFEQESFLSFSLLGYCALITNLLFLYILS